MNTTNLDVRIISRNAQEEEEKEEEEEEEEEEDRDWGIQRQPHTFS